MPYIMATIGTSNISLYMRRVNGVIRVVTDCVLAGMDADVNECDGGEGCSYRCRNIDGGFFCQCPAAGPPTPTALCVGMSSVLR